MKEKVRFDSRRVRLRAGEYERADKRYEYRYTVFGKEHFIYAKTLEDYAKRKQALILQSKKSGTKIPIQLR